LVLVEELHERELVNFPGRKTFLGLLQPGEGELGLLRAASRAHWLSLLQTVRKPGSDGAARAARETRTDPSTIGSPGKEAGEVLEVERRKVGVGGDNNERRSEQNGGIVGRKRVGGTGRVDWHGQGSQVKFHRSELVGWSVMFGKVTPGRARDIRVSTAELFFSWGLFCSFFGRSRFWGRYSPPE
jgi:hypothetical protein